MLPFKSKVSWSEITFDSIKNVIDLKGLKGLYEQSFQIYKESGRQNSDFLKRDDIKLVIKNGDKYLVSNYCITEFFNIIEQQLIFPDQMGNVYINVKSPVFTVKDYENRHEAIYKEYSVNSITSKNESGSSSLKQPLERPLNFFSGTDKIAAYTAYKFWQFSDWRIADGLNSRRGIDRFLYIPEIGIVGGSFDFWFEKFASSDDLLANYLSEKIMLPTLINGKVVN